MFVNVSNFTTLNIFTDLKEPKEKYNVHYERCKGRLFRAATRTAMECFVPQKPALIINVLNHSAEAGGEVWCL